MIPSSSPFRSLSVAAIALSVTLGVLSAPVSSLAQSAPLFLRCCQSSSVLPFTPAASRTCDSRGSSLCVSRCFPASEGPGWGQPAYSTPERRACADRCRRQFGC
jgi:hypothetical protein